MQVIDGIRHVDVWHAVQATYDGAALFFLDSPLEQRYHRYRARHGYSEDEFSLAQFTDLARHPIEAGIGELRAHADAAFDASLPLSALVDEIDHLISRTGWSGT